MANETLSETIYEILNGYILDIGASNICYGIVETGTSGEKLINFNSLPSPGAVFGNISALTNYQFDIWAQDIVDCETLKFKLSNLILGLAEIRNGTPIIFNLTADQGIFYESDSDLYHGIITVGVKWLRNIN